MSQSSKTALPVFTGAGHILKVINMLLSVSELESFFTEAVKLK